MNHLISKSTNLHGTKSSLSSLPFDLNVFKESKAECNRTSDDIPLTESCSVLKRLCAAAKYFDAVRTTSTLKDIEKKSIFIEFNQEIYRSMVDDVTHFIKEHDNDIDRIHSEWTKLYGFPKCSVSECVQTERHYNGGRRDSVEKRQSSDDDFASYYFYESLFDRTHHYVFHLYDVGLRLDTSSLILNEEEGDQKEMETEGVTVDKKFAAERDQIRMRRKECSTEFDRFDNDNNKFAIKTVQENNGMTLRDAICEEIARKEKNQSGIVQRLHQFMEQNAFDSDAVDMDLREMENSNIYALIQMESVVKTMKSFIRSINLRRAAFSTGFEFKYQKEFDWRGCETKTNIPYVKAKYKNLKEEILGSGHLTISKWTDLVVLKARNYWNTNTVKKLKENGLNGGPFGNHPKHELSLEHLIAIILYCDFSVLCTVFSGTYRRKNVFESLESVVLRHSEFAHFGELLVETVNWFGICRDFGNGAQGPESGPFYCGINRVLNIGSFAITLKGPCSTTTMVAVAMSFAEVDGNKGILLKLDNDTRFAADQMFFDCSWISRYFEEQERLWIAGRYPQRIDSIVIIENALNYSKAMRALYLFDAMISGVHQGGFKRECDHSDFELISKLIKWTLKSGDHGTLKKKNQYLLNEWNLFLLQKRKKINLNMLLIHKYYRSLSDLVVFKLVKYGRRHKQSAKAKDNGLRPEWISLFASLESVSIDTDGKRFKFRLNALLESMPLISSSITLSVIDNGKWIKSQLSNDILAAFDAAGWNMEYKEFPCNIGNELVIKSKVN